MAHNAWLSLLSYGKGKGSQVQSAKEGTMLFQDEVVIMQGTSSWHGRIGPRKKSRKSSSRRRRVCRGCLVHRIDSDSNDPIVHLKRIHQSLTTSLFEPSISMVQLSGQQLYCYLRRLLQQCLTLSVRKVTQI